MKIDLKGVRLAFPNLFKATTVNGEGEPAFNCALLMEPDHPAVKQLREACEKIGQEKWGAKWAVIKKELVAKDRLAIHDGDTKANYAGFEGNMYVSARNKVRPSTVDRQGNPVNEQDGVLYAGCYVLAKIELWAQDNGYGKRINASLRGIQFMRDGEAFSGGGAAAASEFEDLGVEEGDEAFA
jgi:hypothetical protein